MWTILRQKPVFASFLGQIPHVQHCINVDSFEVSFSFICAMAQLYPFFMCAMIDVTNMM